MSPAHLPPGAACSATARLSVSKIRPLPGSHQDRPSRSSFTARSEGSASVPVKRQPRSHPGAAGRSVLSPCVAVLCVPRALQTRGGQMLAQRVTARSGSEPQVAHGGGENVSPRCAGSRELIQAGEVTGRKASRRWQLPQGEGAGSTVRGRRRDRVERRRQETLVTAEASPSRAGPRRRSRGAARSGSGRPRRCGRTSVSPACRGTCDAMTAV